MEAMAISKFKATCLAVLERVRRTRKPVLVTRFGKPMAEVGPPSAATRRLGSLAGSVRVRGNIVSPATRARDWKALRS